MCFKVYLTLILTLVYHTGLTTAQCDYVVPSTTSFGNDVQSYLDGEISGSDVTVCLNSSNAYTGSNSISMITAGGGSVTLKGSGDSRPLVNYSNPAGSEVVVVVNATDASIVNIEFNVPNGLATVNNEDASVVLDNIAVHGSVGQQALHLLTARSLTVLGSHFYDNAAASGGCIQSSLYTDVLIVGSNFTANSVSGDGAVFNANSGGTLAFVNSSFSDNTAGNSGGAVFIDTTYAPVSFTGCLFDSNSVDNEGGAIHVQWGDAVNVTGCDFYRNHGDGGGGAVFATVLVRAWFMSCAFIEQSSRDSGVVIQATSVTRTVVLSSYFGRNTQLQAWRRGVLYISATSSHVEGCLFEDNYRTGLAYNLGLYVAFGTTTAVVKNCNFTGAVSFGSCSDVYLSSQYANASNIRATDSTVQDDETGDSIVCLYAGVQGIYDNVTVTGCVSKDSAVRIDGGGVDTLSNSVITHNTVFDDDGGGLHVQGTVTLDGVTVANNVVLNGFAGGGIHAYRASVTVGPGGLVVANNTATANGGGIYFEDCDDSVLANVLIENNTASDWGGGVFIDLSPSIAFVDCVIRRNTAHVGGGGIVADGHIAASNNVILELNNTAVTCNEAPINTTAGLYAFDNAVVTLDSDCTIANNYVVSPSGDFPPFAVYPDDVLANVGSADTASVTGYVPLANDDPRACFGYLCVNGDPCVNAGVCVDPDPYTDFYGDVSCDCSASPGGGHDEFCAPSGNCGNGGLDGGEECDDGNNDADDGCDPNCLLECGNGQDDGDEECDDGNVVSGDGCSDACTLEGVVGKCRKTQWQRKGQCVPCPYGGYCNGGPNVLPKPGFWAPDSRSPPTECPVYDACPGVVDEDGDPIDPPLQYDSNGRPITDLCRDDYTDAVCSKCKSKRLKDGQRCVPCPSDAASTAGGLVFVSALLIVVLAFAVAVLPDKQLDMLVAGILVAQMFVLVGRDATKHLPGLAGQRAAAVYRYFSVITFDVDFMQLGCNREEALEFADVFWGTLALVVIASALFSLAALLNVTQHYFRGKLRVGFAASAAYHVVHVNVLLGVAAYVQITLRVLQGVNCVQVYGEPRLHVEMATSCYTGRHASLGVMAWLLMVGYVLAFPVFVLYVGWMRPAELRASDSFSTDGKKRVSSSSSRSMLFGVEYSDHTSEGEQAEPVSEVGSAKLNGYSAEGSEPSGGEEEEEEQQSDSSWSGSVSVTPNDAHAYRAMYGFLIRNLHKHAYWFQALRLVVVFVIVLDVVVPRNTSFKLLGGAIILMVNVVVVGVVWPFKSRFGNIFQIISGLLTSLQTVVLLQEIVDPRYKSVVMFAVTLTLVLLVSGIIAANLLRNKSLLFKETSSASDSWLSASGNSLFYSTTSSGSGSSGSYAGGSSSSSLSVVSVESEVESEAGSEGEVSGSV